MSRSATMAYCLQIDSVLCPLIFIATAVDRPMAERLNPALPPEARRRPASVRP
jgi:hypothetical protein